MNKWTRVNKLPNLPLGVDGTRVTASSKHIEISKNAAKEGMVLLKNNDNLLPLKKGTKVALFGKGTIDYVKGGGGSGDVTVSYTRNIYEGIKKLDPETKVFEPLVNYYKEKMEEQYEKGASPGLTTEPELPEDLLNRAKEFTDTAIISISRFSGEGWDRSAGEKLNLEGLDPYGIDLYEKATSIFESSDFYLTTPEKEMIDAVKFNFANVIVVMNVGGMVDVSWIKEDDMLGAGLLAWQGGIEGGLATAELLFGEGNPSGKLCDTFARDLTDYPYTDTFHNSLDYVEYTEDIFVGYRFFETFEEAGKKVIYPFGYGLSYTTFDIKTVSANAADGKIYFTVNVKNIGAVAGKEVVQVYYGAPQGVLGKAKKELGAFLKTKLLEAGEEQTMILTIDAADMASYDDLGKIKKACYILEAGEYKFYVGNNVADAAEIDYKYVLAENVITQELTTRMTPTSLSKRLLANGEYEELPIGPDNDFNANALEPMTKDEMSGGAPTQRAIKRFRCWEGPVLKDVKPLIAVANGEITLDEFIAQLSDEDLAYLLSGTPNTGVANTFGYGNLPEFGVPSVMTADGPAGLRITPDCGVCTTAFPCSTLIACTFNPEVAYAVGAAGGAEVKENNIAVWLTPAVNIHRSPLCGRNFEYYSEDPFLAGKMAAAMVNGIQSENVGATAKHFACNDKETNRMESDSRLSERALREIYLKQFEIIVKESNPWSIMTSYNIINGHRASENKELIYGILKGEWGYEGMVTTDWWAHSEQYKEVLAGNDVKMGCGYPERLLEAVEKGALTREDMVKCAKRILELILKID